MISELSVDLFELLKRTEEEISSARGVSPLRSLKSTTGLWLDLNFVSMPTDFHILFLAAVDTADAWDEMTRLRVEVESSFGNAPETVELMIQEIRSCQAKLNAAWYLARLRPGSEAVGEIGIVRFELSDRRIGRLQDVDVIPRHQGKGFGNRLIRSIVSKAKEEGLTDLCLKADTGSWQEEWYRRLGFIPIGNWLS